MTDHANDNHKPRTIEPFHRLYADGLLHQSHFLNNQLFYVGQRYASSYEKAGRISLLSPQYTVPVASRAGYDAYRDVSVIFTDHSRPYSEAAQALNALGLLELVEAIVIHGQPVVEVGKLYSGRRHDQQARSAAITALGIGLLLLRVHYQLPRSLAA